MAGRFTRSQNVRLAREVAVDQLSSESPPSDLKSKPSTRSKLGISPCFFAERLLRTLIVHWFLGDHNIVRMAFAEATSGDTDELGFVA